MQEFRTRDSRDQLCGSGSKRSGFEWRRVEGKKTEQVASTGSPDEIVQGLEPGITGRVKGCW